MGNAMKGARRARGPKGTAERRLLLYLDEALHEAFRAAAEQQRVTYTMWIREAMWQRLAREAPRGKAA